MVPNLRLELKENVCAANTRRLQASRKLKLLARQILMKRIATDAQQEQTRGELRANGTNIQPMNHLADLRKYPTMAAREVERVCCTMLYSASKSPKSIKFVPPYLILFILTGQTVSGLQPYVFLYLNHDTRPGSSPPSEFANLIAP